MFHFSQLSEVRTAMVAITEQGWVSRLIRLNRNEDILDAFNRHLSEAHQRFMVSRRILLLILIPLISGRYPRLVLSLRQE